MEATRILLANAHPLVRNNVRALLERESDFRVVGEAADGRETILLCDYLSPNAVLLDFNLAMVNGLAVARELAAKKFHPAILFLSGSIDEEYIVEAFRAGARGFVQSERSETELTPALRTVARGGSFLSPGIGKAPESLLFERLKQIGVVLEVKSFAGG